MSEYQFQAEFHDPTATVELLRIQEECPTIYVGVGAAKSIVGCANQRTGLQNGRLGQREVAMVENVLHHRTKLDSDSLRDVGVLEHSHIPDVNAR